MIKVGDLQEWQHPVFTITALLVLYFLLPSNQYVILPESQYICRIQFQNLNGDHIHDRQHVRLYTRASVVKLLDALQYITSVWVIVGENGSAGFQLKIHIANFPDGQAENACVEIFSIRTLQQTSQRCLKIYTSFLLLQQDLVKTNNKVFPILTVKDMATKFFSKLAPQK